MPEEHTQPADTVGSVLRRLREQRQLTLKDASDAMDWSTSKLSRLETSTSRIKPEDLERALVYYRADSEIRAAVGQLIGSQAGRFTGQSVALPEAYEQYKELEAAASQISMYAAVVVPGLLQTPEYAAAVINGGTLADEQAVRTRLDARSVRQGRVFGGPATVDVVIDEAVLLRPIGDAGLMRRQWQRLHELAGRPHTSIRVLPFAAGPHPALTGPFAILDFDDGKTDPNVFCDGLTGGVLRSRAEDVRQYRACFAKLQRLALDDDGSTAWIASLAA